MDRVSEPGGRGAFLEVAPELAAQLLAAVGQAVVATDLRRCVIYWNRTAQRMYGWTPAEALGTPITDLITPIEMAGEPGLVDDFLSSFYRGDRHVAELEVQVKAGRRLWIRAAHSPIHDADGALVGLVAVAHDASLRRRQEEEIAQSETRFRALVQRSNDVAVIVGLCGDLRYVSPAAKVLLGYEPEDLVGTNGWDLVHPDDLDQLRAQLAAISEVSGANTTTEYRIRTADGRYRWVEQTVTNMLDEPAVDGIVANIRDVDDRKRVESDLSHRVLHDELTGLPNRVHLDQALRTALAETTGAAVLIFDIDQFKLINDSYGHAVGDELLTQVSARLHHALRPGDTAGRFGGDEFVVVCREVSEPGQAEQIAERLQAALRTPFQLAGAGPVFVSASVGIAAGMRGTSPAELFHDADAAMYHAKRTGRARHAVYDDVMRATASRRLRVENELRRALDDGQIVAYYQPIVDVATGALVGAEALARWQHPTRGLVGPAEFIGVAEDTGLIIELGRRILSLALTTASRWKVDGHPLLVSVNLSAHQLTDPGLVAMVAGGLSDAGILPGQLALEVTETAVMTDPKRSIAVVEELAGMGLHLALDDFGTGYSSLAYLKQLPVTTVKIDRGFVAGVDSRPDDRDIVGAIIQLASSFKRFIVAEGVETAGQLEALKELGCPFAQGFYWSRPVDSTRFEEFIEHGVPPHAAVARPRIDGADWDLGSIDPDNLEPDLVDPGYLDGIG